MSCFFCRGHIEDGFTTFLADTDNCIVIIRNVPSRVCSQCGEISYSDYVAGQLERIVNSAKRALSEVSIINYDSCVA